MVTLLNEIIHELRNLRDRTHFDGEATGIETAIALIEDYRDAYITALDRDLDKGGNIGGTRLSEDGSEPGNVLFLKEIHE